MNPDFKDLLSAFAAHGVEFLVVGAPAARPLRPASSPSPAGTRGGLAGQVGRERGVEVDLTECRTMQKGCVMLTYRVLHKRRSKARWSGGPRLAWPRP